MIMQSTQSYGGSLSPDTLQKLRSSGVSDDDIANQMAQSSPHLKDQLTKIRGGFANDPAATTAFLNLRFYGDPAYTPAPAQTKGYIGRTLDGIYQAANNFVGPGGIMDQYNQGKITSGQAVLRGAGQIFHGATLPVTEAANSVVKAGVDNIPGVKPALQYVGNEIANSDLGKAAAPLIQKGVQAYQNLPQDSGFRDLAAVGQAGLDTANVLGADAAANAVGQGTKATLRATGGAIAHPIQTIQNVREALPAVGSTKVAAAPLSALGIAGKKAGIDERVTNLLESASPEDRTLMQQTLQRYEAGAKDFSAASPKEIPGETILMRARHLEPIKQEVGKRIGNIVSAAADEPISLQNTYENFVSTLRDKGVYIDNGVLKSDVGSVPKGDMPFYQDIYNRLNPTGGFEDDVYGAKPLSFKDAHLTRQWLFKEQNLAKARMAGYSDDAQRIADNVHSGLLQDMSVTHPQYGILAKPYAEMSQSMDNFARLMGKNSSEELTARSLKAGEVVRRVLGNASADVKGTLDQLDSVAKQYGFTGKTSIENQVRFADSLSQYFPTSATASLEGGVEKGVAKAIGTVAKLKTGNVVGAGVDVIQALAGKSPEKQLKIIKNMLSTNAEELAAAQTPEQVSAIVSRILEEDTPLSQITPGQVAEQAYAVSHPGITDGGKTAAQATK